MFDFSFQGIPPYGVASNAPALGVDTLTGTIWSTSPSGWVPSGNQSVTKTSATQPTFRVVDGELTLSATTTAVSGSVVGVRGNTIIASGSTVTAGYLYGAQGKLTIKGTLNTTNGEYAAGLVAQLDLSAATSLTGSLQALWVDMGATAVAGATVCNAVSITNTTSKVIHSVLNVVADATYFADITDLSYGGAHFFVSGASGGSNSANLLVKVNGTAYKIQLYA
jgi:hypothetical protein